MLIKCPECELQVSDLAISCPHCGYPLKHPEERRRTTSKRKRLPNGFGQITELKNQNLRKPYRAMVTVGKTETGRPITKLLKPIAYFKTYNEAYAALVDYNRNPYDLSENYTMSELYDQWLSSKENGYSIGSLRSIKAAWDYCSILYTLPVRQVRIRHLKGCIDDAKALRHGEYKSATARTKETIKSLLNVLFDYAIEKELTDKNYARLFSLSQEISKESEANRKGHMQYTEHEMSVLWNIKDDQIARMILIQCYSGWRPQELVNIKLSDIQDGVITGGSKTSAGKNRVVPIHSKIAKLIDMSIDRASKYKSIYLFCKNDGSPLDYHAFRNRYVTLISSLGFDSEHRPHDGRVHFVTMAKDCGVDEYAIKHLVGHAITDITEAVYTKRNVSWLKTEIEKIK